MSYIEAEYIITFDLCFTGQIATEKLTLNKLNKEIGPSNIYLILYINIEITITITIFELGAGLYKSQQIFIHPYQHMTLMSYVLHHMP